MISIIVPEHRISTILTSNRVFGWWLSLITIQQRHSSVFKCLKLTPIQFQFKVRRKSKSNSDNKRCHSWSCLAWKKKSFCWITSGIWWGKNPAGRLRYTVLLIGEYQKAVIISIPTIFKYSEVEMFLYVYWPHSFIHQIWIC